MPDGFTALGMAAAAAPRLEVGTAVTQVPLRPPLELAQRVATLAVASGGRFCDGLAFGGWQETNLRPPIVVGGRPDGRWFRQAAASDRLFNGWMGSMRSATADELCAGLQVWRAAAGNRRALVSTIPNGLPNLADVLAQLAEAGFDDAPVFADRHDDAELARLRALIG